MNTNSAPHEHMPDETELVLGIELGSTRIKAVLVDSNNRTVASGGFAWENRFEDGIWTYHLDDVWHGLQACYQSMAASFEQTYHRKLRTLGAIGFSGMMHGYLPFDAQQQPLVPFRTWRNTTTAQAADELTALLSFNIPQRWSISHLYQAVLNGEPHVSSVAYLTTLAGYVHWKLTGNQVVGVGEASGMFPIDSNTGTYNQAMLQTLEAHLAGRGLDRSLEEILPRVLAAGAPAGTLTPEGALLLDPSGCLQPGIPLCPPEGDAGTGMVATNAVSPRSGNVSAGTSIFAMVVLERALDHVYPEIDMVTTPDGLPVAMVHCNNGTSEINAWVSLFREFSQSAGLELSDDALYGLLFQKALEGEGDCSGVLTCNYLSGEPVTGLEKGVPLVLRTPESRFTLQNFMRSQIYASVASLKIGMDLLFLQEQVGLDLLYGHGGLFKTPVVGQKILASAVDVPVSVMETAGEGGAWGIAVLANYMLRRDPGESLPAYLKSKAFRGVRSTTIEPDEGDRAGFAAYLDAYKRMLEVEKTAVRELL